MYMPKCWRYIFSYYEMIFYSSAVVCIFRQPGDGAHKYQRAVNVDVPLPSSRDDYVFLGKGMN